jgi:hypothetical protein
MAEESPASTAAVIVVGAVVFLAACGWGLKFFFLRVRDSVIAPGTSENSR